MRNHSEDFWISEQGQTGVLAKFANTVQMDLEKGSFQEVGKQVGG